MTQKAFHNWLWLVAALITAFSFEGVVCVGLVSTAEAQSINLASSQEEIFLGPYLDYLEDEKGTLDISEIARPETSWKFKRCKRLSPGFGFTSSVFWFRFSLNNPSSRPLTRFLEIEYPLLDHVDLYVPSENGRYRVFKEGDRLRFDKRPIKYRNFVFILKIPPNSKMDYYLRVKTSSSLNIPARLYTQAAFMDKIENEETAVGIYFGILFAMLAYNLILFFTIKESVYLYYVLFVIFYFLFQLDLTGVAFKYLWPQNIYWANESLPFFIFAAYFFGTIFTRQIVNSKEYAPILDKILAFLMVVSLVFGSLCLIVPYDISIRAATLVSMTVVVHVLAGFLCLCRGYRPARYYALAWSISMAGAAIYALKSFGLLPNNFVTVWGIQIGSAWEVILLSMALSDRLSLLQKEKDAIQTEYTRRLEEANLRLEDFAKTLEEKVRQRTLELEKSNALLMKQAEEMRLAEEMAERASKAKSDFLANMSHEIRTPLNAITGITALALDMELPEKLKGYLKVIKVSANSLLDLVNDILDFSKIEAGKMELETTDFDLMVVFENIADMFSETASEKSIEFIIDVGSRVPRYLRGDPTRLGQLLTNLVSNAIKFTERGHVFLSCNVVSLQDNKVQLSFVVSDTGIGIEKERLDYLFDMFTQADSSTTRRFGGTGLGLTICKRIASLMGGSIEVESKPEQGTTFTFNVEIEKAKKRPVDQETKEFDSLTNLDLDLYLLTRNPIIAISLKNILKRLSFERVTVMDPDEFEPSDSPGLGGEIRTCIIVDVCEKDVEKLRSLIGAYKHREFLFVVPFDLQERLKNSVGEGNFFTVLKPATYFRIGTGLSHLLTPEKEDSLEDEERLQIRFHNTKILVVEDNEINQMVAREILERFGAHVEFASNGLEALEKAHPELDVIFMDIQMPEMDGYEAAASLRKREEFSGIPIIAMTAGVFKEDRQKCFEAGMDDFVMKPVTPESVVGVLRKWLDPGKIIHEIPKRFEPKNGLLSLPEIPGIDVQQAEKRFASNPGLYLELLRKFVTEQKDIEEKVRSLINQKDQKGLASLKRFFHTQKGVSANLALEQLRKLFFEAEMAAESQKKSLGVIVSQIVEHITTLEHVLRELGGTKKTFHDKETAHCPDAEIKKLILQLDELLQLNDIECEDVWRNLKEKLKNRISSQELTQLDGLIEDLEFEVAREHLVQITSKL